MLTLSLRPTTFDGGSRANHFAVIWTFDEFGVRRVGRVRPTTELNWRQAETRSGL
jgi:hypothetical protein